MPAISNYCSECSTRLWSEGCLSLGTKHLELLYSDSDGKTKLYTPSRSRMSNRMAGPRLHYQFLLKCVARFFRQYRVLGGALFLLAFHSSISLASDVLDGQFWTYQEYSNLFSITELTAAEFASGVRGGVEKYRGSSSKPVRIAIIYPGNQSSDYWRRSVSSFEARLIESGLPHKINTYFTKPGSEVRLQAMYIADALQEDPDYLVFTLDALQHSVIIERLIAKGRPKIILQNITTPLKRWQGSQPFLYVGFDHAVGTGVLANEYLSRFNPGGRYAIFYGPRGYVSRMRGGTFKTLMSAQPGMELVAEYYTGFDRQRARDAALQLFDENNDVDFIFSCSTDIALGVIDAIAERELQQQVITNGWGGGRSELDALTQGKLAMTVMRMNDDNGVAMADAILRDQQGRKTPTIFSGDMHLVTSAMTANDVEELSQQAFRYSDLWSSQIPVTSSQPRP